MCAHRLVVIADEAQVEQEYAEIEPSRLGVEDSLPAGCAPAVKRPRAQCQHECDPGSHHPGVEARRWKLKESKLDAASHEIRGEVHGRVSLGIVAAGVSAVIAIPEPIHFGDFTPAALLDAGDKLGVHGLGVAVHSLLAHAECLQNQGFLLVIQLREVNKALSVEAGAVQMNMHPCLVAGFRARVPYCAYHFLKLRNVTITKYGAYYLSPLIRWRI